MAGYLQDFLFAPDRIRQKVKSLSGGERNRLLLAKLFTEPSNLLVLDEPTNDLDTETLEMLEARLLDYPGTVLVVSHDRQFLDNLCSSTLVFEGGGVVGEYVGGYSDWQRMTQSSAKVSEPVPTSDVKVGSSGKPARKLSNREREEWKALPASLEGMEQELATLQARMAEASFFRGDPDDIRTASERVSALPQEIEATFMRWAELDERA